MSLAYPNFVDIQRRENKEIYKKISLTRVIDLLNISLHVPAIEKRSSISPSTITRVGTSCLVGKDFAEIKR